MASFTDQIVAFNPYIQQLPVDDYVRVGMIKQEQYNRGVEKVQGYIDSVAGLEVIKPEQKDYLHKRITNLQNEVGKVVQADFSNQQLVNSVGSLTSKIASDPIIQTSVASTQTYKQGLAAMKDARDKGKSSISNEWDFQNQFQKWYGDRDVSSRFSGSFTPYTDVTGKVSKIIKELEPNSQIEDNPFKRGPNGQIMLDGDGLPQIDFAMIEKGSKTLTPERIKAAIQANLTQDDLNQLNIDGRYSYRGQDGLGMQEMVKNSYGYRLEQVNDIIRGLLVDRAASNNDPQRAAQIDAQIQNFKDRAVAYQNGYRQDVASINSNLEGFKGHFYANNWLTRFGDGYAYAQNSLTYKENPYFMAAERRRENDIKFEEFKAKLAIDQAQLGLEQERLRLGWYNAETSRASLSMRGSKKTAQGALDGIGLDDPVLEPIEQASLEDVNLKNFLAETKSTGDEIETQKMALLAQNTDLVVLKRDANGQNAHYEYNVAGRDPNTVKSEAEAAMLKLKEAYDQDPSSVDDGVRTYFKSLANTDQMIQNRKFAIGNLETQADRDVGNIKDLTRNIAPLTFGTTGGGNYRVSADEIVAFNRKLKEAFVPGGSGGTGGSSPGYYDKKKIAQLLTTPAERAMYSIWNKPESERNEFDDKVIAKLSEVNQRVNIPNRKLIDQRQGYIDNSIREAVGTQQPVSFSLDAFEAPDRKRAQNVAASLVASTDRAGKSNTNNNFDMDRAKEMLGKNAENTTYSLVSKGRNQFALRMNNSIVGESVDMDITRRQAEELFGQGQFLDDFYNIRQSLQLTKSTGKWTTDVRGLGKESAFNLANGALNKYSIKYHVEDPLKNGGLQVRMYIYDRQKQAWLPERTANFGQLLNEAQVTKFLSQVGDQYIDSIIGTNQP